MMLAAFVTDRPADHDAALTGFHLAREASGEAAEQGRVLLARIRRPRPGTVGGGPEEFGLHETVGAREACIGNPGRGEDVAAIDGSRLDQKTIAVSARSAAGETVGEVMVREAGKSLLRGERCIPG